MKQTARTFLRFPFPGWTVPLGLVAVSLAAFGGLLPSLGFYQDDWPPIYFAYVRGLSSLWELLQYQSRPYASYAYAAGFSLLGFKPLAWQLATLLLRILTVIVTWLYLRALWPARPRETAAAALLFAVYPLFKQQPMSVTYSIHWLGFLLFALSIWLMILAFRQPRRYWLFTPLALLAAALHLLVVEYFAGLELVRPLILWLLLSERGDPARKRLAQTLKYWAPYLLVLLGFFAYRVFLIPRPYPGFDQNPPAALYDLLVAPFTTFLDLLELTLQDAVNILVAAWNNALSIDLFAITRSANLKILLIAIVLGLALYFYLRNLRFPENSTPIQPDAVSAPDSVSGELLSNREAVAWPRSALALGLAFTLAGPIPAWVTYQGLTASNPLWSDRFGIASMVGASLVVVALLAALVESPKSRNIILAALIAVSVSWHIRIANDYRWSTTKQSRFFYQLYWRAPYVEPGTTFLSDGELFQFMGEYPTSFALGVLYSPPKDEPEMDYWFFGLYKHFVGKREEMVAGTQVGEQVYSATFLGDSLNSLVFDFRTEENQCLWVLRPADFEIRSLPDITRDFIPISNPTRIRPGSPLAHPPDPDVFGPEPEHTWCYFYEKADLARQLGNWDEIVSLWDQAAERGFAPANGVEYLPFIEGFARIGDWETARDMTRQANRITHVMAPILCQTWDTIEAATSPSPARQSALDDVNDLLTCP